MSAPVQLRTSNAKLKGFIQACLAPLSPPEAARLHREAARLRNEERQQRKDAWYAAERRTKLAHAVLDLAHQTERPGSYEGLLMDWWAAALAQLLTPACSNDGLRWKLSNPRVRYYTTGYLREYRAEIEAMIAADETFLAERRR